MCVNCAAWVFYALLLTDWYIYFGNLPGMLLGMFYVLTCYKFSKEAVSCCGLWLVVDARLCSGVGCAAHSQPDNSRNLGGFLCIWRQ